MLNLIKLESRIVLDGAGVGEAVGHAVEHDAHAHENGKDHVPDHENNGDQKATVAEAAALLADAPDAATEPLDIVLVSDNLPDYQTLVDAVNPQAQVIVYDGDAESTQDVIDRVTALSQESGRPIHSLTVLSHGGSGYFELGNGKVTADNLDENADAWADLDDSMAEDGQIYVYGCGVANDSGDGMKLLNGLSKATGAEVYASNDVTGKGGNWELEASSEKNASEIISPLNGEKLAIYGSNLQDGPIFPVTVPADPARPSLGDFVTWNEDTVLSINFVVEDGDGVTPSSDLTLEATSNNQSIVPNNGITLSPPQGNGNVWTINIVPQKDQFGDGTEISITAKDGVGNIGTESFILNIQPVNDPPDFTPGPDQATLENSGEQIVQNWATDISPGPSNESNQNVTFIIEDIRIDEVFAESGSLFASAPSVNSDGTLSYTPEPGAYGTATVFVKAQDDGGTANGGNDTSAIKQFQITILPTPQVGEGVTYVENEVPVSLNIELIDSNDTGNTLQVEQAVVEITAGQFDGRGVDQLVYEPPENSGIDNLIQIDRIQSTGRKIVLNTVSGSSVNIADFENALQYVQFVHVGGPELVDTGEVPSYHNGDDPIDTVQNENEPDRQISVSLTYANPSGIGNSIIATGNGTIDVDAVNDAPVFEEITGNPDSFGEGCTPIPILDISESLTITDVDDTNLTRAVIEITNPQQGDKLIFNNSPNIELLISESTDDKLVLVGTNEQPVSIAQFEAALQTVTYQNSAENPVAVDRSIKITITDNNSRTYGDGPSNTGGPGSAEALIPLKLKLNVPPILDLDSTDVTPELGTLPSNVDPEEVDYDPEEGEGYRTGTEGFLLTNDGVILDDGTQLSSLQVKIRNMAEGDVLTFNTEGTNLSGDYQPSIGTLTLSGEDSIQHYQQVLNTITFSNTNETLPENLMYTREIEFQATDTRGDTCAIKDSNVAVAFVDVLPGGPNLSEIDDVTYVENCPPIPIAKDVVLKSQPDTNITSLTVTIDNPQPGDILLPDLSGTTNVTISEEKTLEKDDTLSVTISGLAPEDTYQTILNQIKYSIRDPNVEGADNPVENPNSEARIVVIKVVDENGNETVIDHDLWVIPVNDAPILNLPASVPIPADVTEFSFSDVFGDQFVQDVDNDAPYDDPTQPSPRFTIQAELSVDMGTIRIPSDLEHVEITNNGGSRILIKSEDVPSLNAALQSLTYTPLAGIETTTTDVLTITVNDYGNTGIDEDLAGCSENDINQIDIDKTTGQVQPPPGAGGPNDPTAQIIEGKIPLILTVSDINVVPETPEPPSVPFLPITRPEGRDLDGITLETVRLPGPVGITEGVGRPIFESRALAGRDFFDFCSIEESLRSHLGCRFANTGNPEAQFGSVSWGDFTDLGWKPPYEEHLDEEYDLYTQLFIREQGDPGFNVEANAFQRDLGGLAEQPPRVFEENAGGQGFNEMQPGEVKKTFFAGREQLDKTGR